MDSQFSPSKIPFSALSSWEGVIEPEDLDKVAEVAPLMQVFGYKPEIHRGEYDQFKSQVSNISKFDCVLNSEKKFNYKPKIKPRIKPVATTSARRDYSVELAHFAKTEL